MGYGKSNETYTRVKQEEGKRKFYSQRPFVVGI